MVFQRRFLIVGGALALATAACDTRTTDVPGAGQAGDQSRCEALRDYGNAAVAYCASQPERARVATEPRMPQTGEPIPPLELCNEAMMKVPDWRSTCQPRRSRVSD